VEVILSDRIGRDQPLLFHNTANATSRYHDSLFLELGFQLACTVFVENLHNRFGKFLLLSSFFGFIVERTFGDL